MATVSDLTTTALSGLNHIDALLDRGPDWNYLTPGGNVLLYTFSVSAGIESGQGGLAGFSYSQQSCTRTALDYLTKITGIQFIETADGTAAQIHLANSNIPESQITGLCSWTSSYSYTTSNEVVGYDADAYVYLDNVEWAAQNRDLTPGGYGYETLLHELAHALGLKHPFLEDDDPSGTPVLPAAQDSTAYTLMSYTESGGPHAKYGQFDIAALNWIYGGDGLRGALGINSTTGARYITGTNSADTLTGTQFDDTLEGDGGNDMINGGDGTDTVVFRDPHSAYTFTQLSDGTLQVSSATDGIDTLASIEILHFSDATYQRAQVLGDTTPPAAPTLSVTKNAAGYAMGNSPLVTGSAEANATVKVFSGDKEVGTTKADATGLWSLTTSPFADGSNYSVYAKAIDAAGNTSGASTSVSFNVDATAPSIPSGTAATTLGGNQPVFSGSGEAGSTIQLVRTSDFIEIGRATVGADGKWSLNSSPLPNGDYNVSVVSVDKADNATSAANRIAFTISSAANLGGGSGNDQLHPLGGNNAIDGGAGTDTVLYDNPRANFTISKDIWGYSVVDNVGINGHDSLIDVERVHFSDDAWVALDVNGVAGQAFRLYQAAFDRAPELAGLGYWIWRMDAGTSLNQVAAEFTKQPEFYALYGNNSTNAEFVGHLYNNVLHRPAEGAGFDYWMDALANKHVPREQVLGFFSESPENQAQVIGSIQAGMAFTPWHG